MVILFRVFNEMFFPGSYDVNTRRRSSVLSRVSPLTQHFKSNRRLSEFWKRGSAVSTKIENLSTTPLPSVVTMSPPQSKNNNQSFESNAIDIRKGNSPLSEVLAIFHQVLNCRSL